MFKRSVASLFSAVLIAGFVGVFAGCNTIEGAGKDIEQGGKAIKDEAREQK